MTLENYRKIYKLYIKDNKYVDDSESLTDEEIKMFIAQTIQPEVFNKYRTKLKV